MVQKLAVLAGMSLFLAACGARQPAPQTAPRALGSQRYTACFNAAAFFETDLLDLKRRLPDGYSPREGSFLGSQYAGRGMLALVYFSCPTASAGLHQWALIATPIEDPPVTPDLRPVRWNWYELARLEGNIGRLKTLRDYDFLVDSATFSHDPFRSGDAESRFAVSTPAGNVFSVTAALARPVNFEAQSHRFWHVSEAGSLLSTRLDFDYHPSSLGSFVECVLDTSHLRGRELQGVRCTGSGVTEAVEAIDFSEQIVLWN